VEGRRLQHALKTCFTSLCVLCLRNNMIPWDSRQPHDPLVDLVKMSTNAVLKKLCAPPC
jgi:hypothetical protein